MGGHDGLLASAAKQGFFLSRCWRRGWLLFQFLGNSILGYSIRRRCSHGCTDVYNIGGDDKGTDDSYGNIIPFLVVGLFWWKRKELLALPLKLWWPGLLMLAAAGGAARCGFLLQAAVFFHRRAVRRDLRVDGAGVGARMAAA